MSCLVPSVPTRATTYLVTRRCAERQFLRPSKTTNDVFLYVLAVAAQRFEIQVHAFCVLSNHSATPGVATRAPRVSRGRSSGREAPQGWRPAYRQPRSL